MFQIWVFGVSPEDAGGFQSTKLWVKFFSLIIKIEGWVTDHTLLEWSCGYFRFLRTPKLPSLRTHDLSCRGPRYRTLLLPRRELSFLQHYRLVVLINWMTFKTEQKSTGVGRQLTDINQWRTLHSGRWWCATHCIDGWLVGRLQGDGRLVIGYWSLCTAVILPHLSSDTNVSRFVNIPIRWFRFS